MVTTVLTLVVVAIVIVTFRARAVRVPPEARGWWLASILALSVTLALHDVAWPLRALAWIVVGTLLMLGLRARDRAARP